MLSVPRECYLPYVLTYDSVARIYAWEGKVNVNLLGMRRRYTYSSGKYVGRAYFGRGGSAAEMTAAIDSDRAPQCRVGPLGQPATSGGCRHSAAAGGGRLSSPQDRGDQIRQHAFQRSFHGGFAYAADGCAPGANLTVRCRKPGPILQWCEAVFKSVPGTTFLP